MSYASSAEVIEAPDLARPAGPMYRKQGDEIHARTGRREALQGVSTRVVTDVSRTCVPSGAGSTTGETDDGPKRSSLPPPANDP